MDTAELPGISLKRNAFLPKKKLFRNKKALHVGEVFSCASYNFHFKGSNNVNPFPPMDPKIIKPQPLPTMTGSHQGTYPENSLHPKCLQKNTAEKKRQTGKLMIFLCIPRTSPGPLGNVGFLGARVFSPLNFAGGLLSLL